MAGIDRAADGLWRSRMIQADLMTPVRRTT
jgi:hypothetical protein